MDHVPDHERFMRRAIELSAKGGLEEKTGGCFGAVIVKDGEIVGEGYNHVVAENDPTWHGEVAAIRDAAKKLGTYHLTGCTLYTSAYPCPMCLTAAFWARIDKMYYGARCEDVLLYGAFEDENFYEELAKPPEQRALVPETELLREEAVEVWKKFSEIPNRVHY
ncbi:nucleoside deaminase [Candidatus Synechococcus calcipolaris G9]|uniref:Nucleoside deaminase n=1 Tax=Candidatus Synechococcus calcipolaris G9 TaxID=1497997 RepID=A0ABT6F1U9_9SYNE|nr:nucleoside deaminase [Candidatus Synechococcus calcipolaris]MDG2991819.1 nucleoside deaminase [Candidatus Synechococcus calcipolaris G9]